MNSLAQARSSFQQEYRQKLCSPQDAASLVRSGDHLCFPLFAGEPTLFVQRAGRAQARAGGGRRQPAAPPLPRLLHRGLGPAHPGQRLVHEPRLPAGGSEGLGRLRPQQLPRGAPSCCASTGPSTWPGRWSPPWTSTASSPAASRSPTPWRRSRRRRRSWSRSTRSAPRTHGNCHIHVSEVDHIIECDEPIVEQQLPRRSPRWRRRSAATSRSCIEDGSTLQLGFGGIPNAVSRALLHEEGPGDPHRAAHRRHGRPDALPAPSTAPGRRSTAARRSPPSPSGRSACTSSCTTTR